MHYYSFNIGDYASSTQHLEPMEDLAYRRMLDLYYSKESPLPNDLDEIARLTRMRSHKECIAVVLQDFFVLRADFWHCEKADKEIEKYQQKSEKARKSAQARWKNNQKTCERITDAEETQTESQCVSNANQEPITNNQEPIVKDTSNARASDRIDYSQIQKLFNEKLTKAPSVFKMTDKRKRLVKKFFKEFDFNLEKWKAYLEYINNAKECEWMFEQRDRGNGQTWQPKGFDYIVTESCYLKVKETV